MNCTGRFLCASQRDRPKIATLTVRKESLRSFWNTTAKFVLVFSGILTVFATAIAIGVVYNSARVALAGARLGTREPPGAGLHSRRGVELLLAELGIELRRASLGNLAEPTDRGRAGILTRK